MPEFQGAYRLLALSKAALQRSSKQARSEHSRRLIAIPVCADRYLLTVVEHLDPRVAVTATQITVAPEGSSQWQ